MAPDLSNFVWILALNPPLDRPSAEAKEDPVRSVPAPLWIIFDSENGHHFSAKKRILFWRSTATQAGSLNARISTLSSFGFESRPLLGQYIWLAKLRVQRVSIDVKAGET
jgi:hypothetical protein